MSDLRVTDAAGLKAALSDAPAGAVIELEEGDYEGAWHLRKSVTLRAAGERGDASLWGTGGSVVRVTDDDLVVKIERLTIGDGNAETGGGVHLSGFSRVTLDDCLLEGNTATGGPGGAAAVEAGTLTLKFCDVLNNEAVGASRWRRPVWERWCCTAASCKRPLRPRARPLSLGAAPKRRSTARPSSVTAARPSSRLAIRSSSTETVGLVSRE